MNSGNEKWSRDITNVFKKRYIEYIYYMYDHVIINSVKKELT